MGRVVTRQEAEKLVYYFDQNGNQTVEFDEFKRGVERLVGTGCPHGSGIEYLSQQSAGRRCIYAGDFHDDKRHGCGLFKMPTGWGYLGCWRMGTPHGPGFEVQVRGFEVNFDEDVGVSDDSLPVLVSYVQMHEGQLMKRERFDAKNAAHARLLRRAGLCLDRALKRAKRARLLAKNLSVLPSPAPCKINDGNGHTWKLVESNEVTFDSARKGRH